MVIFNCLPALVGWKKKDKIDGNCPGKSKNGVGKLQVELEHTVKSSGQDDLNSTSFSVTVPFSMPENSNCKVKVMDYENSFEKEKMEAAYEGEDEFDERLPMRRDDSDFNLQDRDCNLSHEEFEFGNANMDSRHSEGKTERDADLDMIQSGHVSDPGMSRVEYWGSPKLKRSCSSLDVREVLKKMGNKLPPSKSQSFEELQQLADRARENIIPGSPRSHTSAMTHLSADKVMLKKRSSSQILPSRSRKLWWKLFLWSHRNLQKPSHNHSKARTAFRPPLNQLGGYSSDTLEPSRARELCTGSPIPEKSSDERDGCQGEVSTLWPPNQWVAFSMHSSPLERVNQWVKNLDVQSSCSADAGHCSDEGIVFPPSPETSRYLARGSAHVNLDSKLSLSEDLLHANSVVQSLNSSSTVAHISGMGLRVIPTISHFYRLRSVNLSNNHIVHIEPGSLPRGLHILDLSRNKISIIEGLRELSRLRVLNLSYNRVSRIGHGLSNCILLKELYLSGNKISEVEGLHRLLKLTVLDLSFNKITTAAALGQLVAHYNSLVALNFLGNPVQGNRSDDQLRKAVCGLLPKLAYLNKQPINQQKAREVGTDIVARASLGSSSSSYRRRPVKKATQGGGSVSSIAGKSNVSVQQRSRGKLKSRSHHHPVSKTRSLAIASSSH